MNLENNVQVIKCSGISKSLIKCVGVCSQNNSCQITKTRINSKLLVFITDFANYITIIFRAMQNICWSAHKQVWNPFTKTQSTWINCFIVQRSPAIVSCSKINTIISLKGQFLVAYLYINSFNLLSTNWQFISGISSKISICSSWGMTLSMNYRLIIREPFEKVQKFLRALHWRYR